MGFVVVRSIDMHRTRGGIGFPAPASHSPFLAVSAVPLPVPSSALLRTRIHPPVDFAPLQSPPVSCLPRASRPEAPSLGLRLPLRDLSPSRRCVGVPSPTPSVLGVSHALDGLIREWPGGFVSPHSHVQGSPSRGFPSRTAAPARHRCVPSRRLTTVDYRVAPAPSPVAPPSGL